MNEILQIILAISIISNFFLYNMLKDMSAKYKAMEDAYSHHISKLRPKKGLMDN